MQTLLRSAHESISATPPQPSLAGMSNRQADTRILMAQTLCSEFIEEFLAKKACGRADGRKRESILLPGSSKNDSCLPWHKTQKEKARQECIPSGLTKSNEVVIRFNESISTLDRVNGGYLS